MNNNFIRFISIASALLMFSGLFLSCKRGKSGVDNKELSSDMKTNNSSVTYYVDCLNGDDNFEGTNPQRAWRTLKKVNDTVFQPGDKLLFKAGGIWDGQLSLRGSGTKDKVIIIDMYGEGSKPIFNGNGILSGTVYLRNQQYWEIRNLEITNQAQKRVDRSGILIEGEDIGVLEHIYVENCYVHNVYGNMDGAASGGIVVSVIGQKVPTKFNDVKIENCSFYQTDRRGISTYSSWAKRNENKWYPHTNIVIRNNYFEDCGKNFVTVTTTAGALVEYNTGNGAGVRSDDNSCGFWPFNSDNAIFQYNEAYGVQGNQDGQGFDCDYNSNGTIMQYNYSHDNVGGFIVVCSNSENKYAFNNDNIIRYNISQNDGRRIFNITGNIKNTNIYNNTIYIGEGIDTNLCEFNNWGGTWPEGTYFYNNIFYNLGKGDYIYGKAKDVIFANNTFYGNHPGGEPEDEYKITEDPMLVQAGSGWFGRDTVEGYKLLPASPCIGSGKEIKDNSGRDYYGNIVRNGAPDRGAHQFSNDSHALTLKPPSIKHVKQIGTGSVQIDFEGVKQAEWYNIAYGLYQYGSKEQEINNITDTTYTIKELNEGCYYFRVNAVRGQEKSLYSDIVLLSIENTLFHSEIANTTQEKWVAEEGSWTVIQPEEKIFDFDSITAKDWEMESGKWQVQGEDGFKQNLMEGGSIYAGSLDWKDYTLSADITLTAFNRNKYGGVGVSFRDDGKGNRYQVLMSMKTENLILQKVTNNKNENIMNRFYRFKPGETYSLRVEVKGSSIKVYINGKEIIEKTNNTYTSGRIGLTMNNATGAYNNVRAAIGETVYKVKGSWAGYFSSGSEGWMDYSAEAVVHFDDINLVNNTGLSIRCSDQNNRYYMQAIENKSISITKIINGKETVLAEKEYNLIPGKAYHFKAVATGNSLEFYINGLRELEAGDSTFSSGKIALSASDTSVEFSNVIVKEIFVRE